jgi:hypothetical protein
MIAPASFIQKPRAHEGNQLELRREKDEGP